MSSKVALITGVTGQDGAYLSRFLLAKGYQVHGVKRRASSFNTSRIDSIYHDPKQSNGDFFLHYGDLTDTSNIASLINKIKPHEIYNLAAQSHVKVSFETAEYTANADAVGVLRVLEAVRSSDLIDKTRFYQASTSELFGGSQLRPQNEETPFNPRSPYAAAKLYGYWITNNYRDAYGIYGVNGILFNHESPLRGETFVTQKIAKSVAAIASGALDCVFLGNLDARRDWGHAQDYVKGMWLMLQQEKPENFVLATGRSEAVRTFVELAFKEVGIEVSWQGQGINEIGFEKATGRTLVRIDTDYFRPTEVDYLCGDATKAKEKLGWEAEISLEDLISEMVQSAMKKL